MLTLRKQLTAFRICHITLRKGTAEETHGFLGCLLYSEHVLWSHPSACIRYKGLYRDPSAATHHLSAMTHGFLDCLLYSVHVLWSHPSVCIRYKYGPVWRPKCCHTSLSAMTHGFLDCLLFSVHVLWSHPSACIRYKGLYGDPSAAIHHCRPGSALLSASMPHPHLRDSLSRIGFGKPIKT
jgi:hypothetical protein